MSLDIDTPPAGTAGQLGVLPRCQRHVLLSVELHQLFQHDGAGGHVDTQRQGLGENSPDQAGSEQLLDGVTECGQHPGVVGGQPAQQPLTPLVVAQHRQVVFGQFAAAVVDDSAIRTRSSSVVSRSGDRRHCWTAASHPARENTNVMAGRSPRSPGCDHVGPGQRRGKARTPRPRAGLSAGAAAASRHPVGSRRRAMWRSRSGLTAFGAAVGL